MKHSPRRQSIASSTDTTGTKHVEPTHQTRDRRKRGRPGRDLDQPRHRHRFACRDTTAVTHGTEASITDVPWSDVGPGWTLATWSPVTPQCPGRVEAAPGEPTWETASTTLYLVDPTGNRYAITTFAPEDSHSMALLDWSGDGSHALFGDEYPAPDTVISIDLHTGAKTTSR